MTADVVLWHDVECGSFSADLPAWRALAERSDGPILELGAGTGRVALDLVRHTGRALTAVEPDPALAAALRERAAGAGEITVLEQDARRMELTERFGLIVGAMQFAQLFDAADRARVLRASSKRLRPGGRLALAIVEPAGIGDGRAQRAVLPDMRESDGWVHASRPLWVTVEEDLISVTRERESVSPEGTVERQVHRDRLYPLDAGELAREAAAAGLAEVDRVRVEPDREAESTIVVLMGG